MVFKDKTTYSVALKSKLSSKGTYIKLIITEINIKISQIILMV